MVTSGYEEFLKLKHDYGSESGFEPLWIPEFLFEFQQSLTRWAVRMGRAAIFADCGMGKTPIQLVWAQNVIEKTNRPILILTPLAVSAQTLDEAIKFDIEAKRAVPGNTPKACIYVTNYEQLHHFRARDWAGVVCDESSILKNFSGIRRQQITEFMRVVPYRLLCTATAAPNDWAELGTSSEALGYLGYMDMLSRYFTNKKNSAALMRGRFRRDKWRLREYAAEGPFWRWVASWARAARRPSDLGFNDDGFVLPELHQSHTQIKPVRPRDGLLFDLPAITFHEEREVRRRTIKERCESAAGKVNGHNISMVWCNLNDEGNLLQKMIPGARQVSGSDSNEYKEEAARWFCKGSDTQRVLISKPSIFGFGLNFQHCAHMTYFPTHSYEQYYQATRRLWRFGQTRPVVVDLIYSDGGQRVMENLQRKARAADQMFDELVRYMHRGMTVQNEYESQKVEIPIWLNN